MEKDIASGKSLDGRIFFLKMRMDQMISILPEVANNLRDDRLYLSRYMLQVILLFM